MNNVSGSGGEEGGEGGFVVVHPDAIRIRVEDEGGQGEEEGRIFVGGHASLDADCFQDAPRTSRTAHLGGCVLTSALCGIPVPPGPT